MTMGTQRKAKNWRSCLGNTIFFVGIVFIFFLAVEFIMMGAFQASSSTMTRRILGSFCRIFLVTFILAYLLLTGLFLFVGVDLLMDGEVSKGLSLLLSAVIVAVCVYVWLIRRWVKHIREK